MWQAFLKYTYSLPLSDLDIESKSVNQYGTMQNITLYQETIWEVDI